jgi:hypothetical protein
VGNLFAKEGGELMMWSLLRTLFIALLSPGAFAISQSSKCQWFDIKQTKLITAR